MDSILYLFKKYDFYNYPSNISNKDTTSFAIGSIVIKVKEQNEKNDKVVNAYLYQEPNYFPESFSRVF